VLGTLAALGARGSFRGKRLYQSLLALPVMIPDIVLAVALLSLFRACGAGLSLATAACAQATYTLAYVAIVVSARLQSVDPALEDAARDLGATPLQAFSRALLPAIRPAILAGALLAFTLAFDDFVVTYFTNGPDRPTLPVLVYSMIRFGVTPEIHALSTILLAVSLALVLLSLKISKVPLTGGSR
jgi:spermidine/putrescine transport system permease protein